MHSYFKSVFQLYLAHSFHSGKCFKWIIKAIGIGVKNVYSIALQIIKICNICVHKIFIILGIVQNYLVILLPNYHQFGRYNQ